MNKLAILQSARIAELRDRASLVASVCKPSAVVELSRNSRRGAADDRRRFLMLLAHERRRNSKLVELLEE
jgi:hypothetical protein